MEEIIEEVANIATRKTQGYEHFERYTMLTEMADRLKAMAEDEFRLAANE